MSPIYDERALETDQQPLRSEPNNLNVKSVERAMNREPHAKRASQPNGSTNNGSEPNEENNIPRKRAKGEERRTEEASHRFRITKSKSEPYCRTDR